MACGPMKLGRFWDEKIFRVNSHRHGTFVTRTLAEKCHPSCVSSIPKFQPQIHVWGAIRRRNIAPLKLLEEI